MKRTSFGASESTAQVLGLLAQTPVTALAYALDQSAVVGRRFSASAGVGPRHRNQLHFGMMSHSVDEATFRARNEALAADDAASLNRTIDSGGLRVLDSRAACWALMGIAHFVGLCYAIWQEREPPPEALDAVFDLGRHGLEPQP